VSPREDRADPAGASPENADAMAGLGEQRDFLLAHAENLERMIERLRSDERRRAAEIAELTARLRAVEADLAAVVGSRSWRWAARLRAAADAVQRLLVAGRR
jgi:hypothetical protein